MDRLLAIDILPYYAQVAIFDPAVDGAYPDWGDGEDEAVSSGNGVAVETRPDHLGTVRVEVFAGEPDATAGGLRNVFETELGVSGDGGLVAGSVTGGTLHRVAVPQGEHRVKVFADGPRGEVDRVIFAFPDIEG